MLSLNTLRSVGIAALIATSGAAFAADMPAPPPLMPAPGPAPMLDAGGGFYLRGDVGHSHNSYDRIYNLPVVAGLRTVSSSLGDSAFFGVGAGYQFNSWFRADATIEYRTGAQFKMWEEDTTATPRGYNLTKGNVAAVVGLANAYVDMGTWNRITPFVGAGIGFATLMTRGVTDTGYGAFAGGSGSAPNRTKTNLAWALHAGLGYDLTANWKAEAAYRYLHMGSVDTGTIRCTVACTAYNSRVKDMNSHDIKVGLRYVFADTVAPVMMPGPLVRKY